MARVVSAALTQYFPQGTGIKVIKEPGCFSQSLCARLLCTSQARSPPWSQVGTGRSHCPGVPRTQGEVGQWVWGVLWVSSYRQ